MNPASKTTETQDGKGYSPYSTRPGPADDKQYPIIEGNNPQHHAKGFAQSWGLHPGVMLVLVLTDSMLFGGQLATLDAIYPLVIAVSVGLGIVTFMAQKKFYGDDNEAAFIKAFVCFGLSAIPSSLPGWLTLPAGVLGFFRKSES